MFKKSLTVSFKPENGMIIYSGLAKRLKFHSSQVKIYPEWSKGHWGIFSKSFENCTIEPPMSPLEKHFSFAEGLLHLLKSIIWRTEKFMYGIICRWNLTACAARISITLQRFVYKYTEQYGYCTIFFYWVVTRMQQLTPVLLPLKWYMLMLNKFCWLLQFAKLINVNALSYARQLINPSSKRPLTNFQFSI